MSKADNLPPSCAIVTKSGKLNFLETSKPVQACNETTTAAAAAICKRQKAKWSRYRPGMAQRVGRGIALLFHDRGTRRGWVISSTPRPNFTPGKDPVPIVQETVWAPGPVWTDGKSRSHREFWSRTVQPVAIPTELHGPQFLYMLWIKQPREYSTLFKRRLRNGLDMPQNPTRIGSQRTIYIVSKSHEEKLS